MYSRRFEELPQDIHCNSSGWCVDLPQMLVVHRLSQLVACDSKNMSLERKCSIFAPFLRFLQQKRNVIRACQQILFSCDSEVSLNHILWGRAHRFWGMRTSSHLLRTASHLLRSHHTGQPFTYWEQLHNYWGVLSGCEDVISFDGAGICFTYSQANLKPYCPRQPLARLQQLCLPKLGIDCTKGSPLVDGQLGNHFAFMYL